MSEFEVTIGAVAGGAILVAWSALGQRRRRPRVLGRVPWMPWNAMMFVGLVTLLFGGVHLVTLSGAR